MILGVSHNTTVTLTSLLLRRGRLCKAGGGIQLATSVSCTNQLTDASRPCSLAVILAVVTTHLRLRAAGHDLNGSTPADGQVLTYYKRGAWVPGTHPLRQ